LIHFDGTNGQTTITDSAQSNLAIEVYNVTLTTATNRFGTASGAWVSSPAGRLKTVPSSLFNFGTNVFTVEGWVNITAYDAWTHRFIGGGVQTDGSNNMWAVGLGAYPPNIHFMNFLYYDGTGLKENTSRTNTAFWPYNRFVHWAIVRDGAMVSIYQDGNWNDGVNIGSTGVSINSGTNGMLIGARWNINYSSPIEALRGKQDEIRISKGIKRYTGNTTYTIPTQPFTP
jgi:hypothetical protein